MSRLPKIFRCRGVNIYKRLRITIDQRKPGALDLHHGAMTAAESVEDVGHGELNLRDLPRFEWFGLLKAVAELSAKNVAAHKLLVSAHPDVGRVGIRVGEIAGINIDEF